MLSVKPWRIEVVVQFVAALIVCICLSVIAGEVLRILGAAGFSQPDGCGPVVLATLCFQGAACLLACVFFRRHQMRVRDGFGFTGPNQRRALLLAVVTVIALLKVVLWLQDQSVAVLTQLGWNYQKQAAVNIIEKADSLWLRVYLGVFAVGIAPVAEEFIFRGVLYPVIKQWGFPRLALVGVSALFALIHFDAATFLPLFVLALALTWLYETTDNLLAPIAAHALFNATNLLVLILQQLDMLPRPK